MRENRRLMNINNVEKDKADFIFSLQYSRIGF